jgi:hypothetical protein
MYGKTQYRKAKEKMSKARKGKSSWNKGLTKETDVRVAKYAKKLKRQTLSDKHKKNLSIALTGNQNAIGGKGSKGCHWNLSDETKEKQRIAAIEQFKDPKQRKDASKRMIGNQLALGNIKSDKAKEKNRIARLNHIRNHPEDIETSIKNGRGTKCHSDDGLFFPSLQERGCYYWVRDDVDEVVSIEHNFLDRVDFLLILNNGEDVALEYHPKTFLDKRSTKQYYKDRKKLLDELGHKDLNLIVMTSLSRKEKERVKKWIIEC